MKTQFSILSTLLIVFARPVASQVYPPQPGDFKVNAIRFRCGETGPAGRQLHRELGEGS